MATTADEAPRKFDLDNIFKYHAPDEMQMLAYGELRAVAKEFAATVIRYVPSGADQADAIRKIREAVMTANAGVALHGNLYK